jgi:hypothetical protein
MPVELMVTIGVIALIVNLITIVGMFVKLENRLTKLEVTLHLFTSNFVTIGSIKKGD